MVIIPQGEGLKGVVWNSLMENVVCDVLKGVSSESNLWCERDGETERDRERERERDNSRRERDRENAQIICR